MKLLINTISIRIWVFIFFLMIGHSAIYAQSKPEAPQKEKVPATEPETIKKVPVKAVPVAKSQNTKPARIVNARANGARPSVTRPARSTRPAGRIVRPGRGQ